MTMADTVAVMNKGRIEQLGPPEELYDLPRTAFVANFLGQSNLFTGEVAGTTSDSITVDIAGTPVTVPLSRAQRHSGDVTVGIRPEKLRLHAEAPEKAAGLNVLGPGRVVDLSFSGVSTQYLIEMPNLGTVVVFAQNIDSSRPVGEGSDAWVSWRVEHGFGLEDEAPVAPKFAADVSTAVLATQGKNAVLSESREA